MIWTAIILIGMFSHMSAKKVDLGPTGETVRKNIIKLRGDGLTYAKFSRQLEVLGNPIPPLGLRRIEAGERKVTVDDLMAICAVLQCTPDYLLFPQEHDSPNGSKNEVTGFGPLTGHQTWVLLNYGALVKGGRPTRMKHEPDYLERRKLKNQIQHAMEELPNGNG